MRQPKPRQQRIQRYDNFCYLWTGLRKALELREQGELTELAARQAEIERSWELMRELGCHNSSRSCRASLLG